MKALTIATALLGGLAFASAASAGPCSFSSKATTAEAPIVAPSTGS
ncbi:MAG: hypothetical protein ACE37J_09820 [Pikeienuella sp.]